MRLGSSQFVFLMLLICSLQVREDYAARLTTAAIPAAARPDRRAPRSAVAQHLPRETLRLETASWPAVLTPLPSGKHCLPALLPYPNLASMAVISHTSLLRA